jgi:HNH endonuclease
MRTIELTQGKQALVDDDDYKLLTEHYGLWSARLETPRTNLWYAVRNERNDRGYLYMHIEIMLANAEHGIPSDMVVHHIDRNGLNNQKANLEIVTPKENTQRHHS